MFRYHKLILITLFMFTIEDSFAQFANVQYLYNRYSISPSYAVFSNGTELFAGYRKERVSFPGSPSQKYACLESVLADNMAVGAGFLSEQVGIFRYLRADFSYTYKIKLSEDHKVSLSLKGGVHDDRFDLSSVNSEEVINDPMMNDKLIVGGTAFNAGVGALYNFKNLWLGLDMPSVMDNSFDFADQSVTHDYRISRLFQAHASYTLAIDDKWAIEPLAIIRQMKNSPFNYEFAAILKYMSNYWLAINYRKSADIGISLGARINDNLLLNYTYELSGSWLGEQASGTHEFGIGINLTKKSATPATYTQPMVSQVQPQVAVGTSPKTDKELAARIDSLNAYVKSLKNDIEFLKSNNQQGVLDPKISGLEKEVSVLKSGLENLVLEMENLKTSQTEIQPKGTYVVPANVPLTATPETKNIPVITPGTTSAQKVTSPQSSVQPTEKAGYYVIFESYKDNVYAQHGIKIWEEKGYKLSLVTRRDMFFLYSDYYTDLNAALDKSKEYRDKGIGDMWVLILK